MRRRKLKIKSEETNLAQFSEGFRSGFLHESLKWEFINFLPQLGSWSQTKSSSHFFPFHLVVQFSDQDHRLDEMRAQLLAKPNFIQFFFCSFVRKQLSGFQSIHSCVRSELILLLVAASRQLLSCARSWQRQASR